MKVPEENDVTATTCIPPSPVCPADSGTDVFTVSRWGGPWSRKPTTKRQGISFSCLNSLRDSKKAVFGEESVRNYILSALSPKLDFPSAI